MVNVSAFAGKQYKLDSSTNFDEYMKALGVGLVTRKMGNAVSPVIELLVNGAEYTLKSSSTFKNTATTFKMGQEIDVETADGRRAKTTFTTNGNKLFELEKSGDKEAAITRAFSDTEVKMTLTVDDIVCTRIYKAV